MNYGMNRNVKKRSREINSARPVQGKTARDLLIPMAYMGHNEAIHSIGSVSSMRLHLSTLTLAGMTWQLFHTCNPLHTPERPLSESFGSFIFDGHLGEPMSRLETLGNGFRFLS